MSSCGQRRQENVSVLLEEPPAENLAGESLNIGGLVSPSRLYFNNGKLLFKDNQSFDAQMYVYDVDSKKTTKYIRRGRGPGELLGAFYFALTEDNKTTLVFDISLGRILKTKTDSLVFQEYYPTDLFDCKGMERNISCICGYGERVLAMGESVDSRVVELVEGDSLKVLAGYSPDIYGRYDKDFAVQPYGGVIKANTSRKSCVIACRYADQLEIVSLETGKPIFIKGPECFEPKSEIFKGSAGAVVAHSSEEKKGYVDVCCDDRYIYALYSGRETGTPNSSYGRSIRVFDWNGEYQVKYILDRDILAIDIDSDNNVVYAISSNDSIVKYTMPL